ncbi:hypothetical protein ABZW47_16120, partial [Streptomyces sp. NPDC004549]|uniref:hypothetical protein n=1 Tax=Streptomyces sp. NPDC004549 TaxID=3154283 RepID=UPI0033B50C52
HAFARLSEEGIDLLLARGINTPKGISGEIPCPVNSPGGEFVWVYVWPLARPLVMPLKFA